MTLIRTERLILNEAYSGDSDFFRDLMNSPGWLAHIGDRNIKSRKDANDYIENTIIKSYRTNDYGLYTMRLGKENSPIGICGLVKRDHLEFPDLGFALLPKYEGQGFAFEAAQSILQDSFNRLDLSIILAITAPKNVRSIQLLKRLGFVPRKETNLTSDGQLLHFEISR